MLLLLRPVEKGYLFILVSLPKRVEGLNVAKIPQETLPTASTSINDVHGDDNESTKTSENAGDDRANDDSFHHILLPPFMMDCCDGVVSHHQCRSNQLRQTGRENLFSSLPVSGVK